MTNQYPRETVEFQPVTVTVDGVAVTTGVQFAIVNREAGTRPTTWTAAVALSGEIGVMITGLTPGFWEVYAQITSTPETPVIDCGYIQVV